MGGGLPEQDALLAGVQVVHADVVVAGVSPVQRPPCQPHRRRYLGESSSRGLWVNGGGGGGYGGMGGGGYHHNE